MKKPEKTESNRVNLKNRTKPKKPSQTGKNRAKPEKTEPNRFELVSVWFFLIKKLLLLLYLIKIKSNKK